MKIVKDKNDVVVFVGDDLELTDKGLVGDGYRAPFCTTSNYVLEEAEAVPADYSGGLYSHTAVAGWVLTDTGNQKAVEVAEIEKKRKAAEVNVARDQKIQSGMPYKFPDGDGVVDIKSDRDIINITGLGVAALALQLKGDTTTKVEYRDEGNINHEMTAPEMIEFGLAFVRWYSQKYKESWAKKDDLQKG